MTSELKQTFKCKYCDREFRKETTLAVHVCEQRKRFQHKNDPASRTAFQSYLKFMKLLKDQQRQKRLMPLQHQHTIKHLLSLLIIV